MPREASVAEKEIDFLRFRRDHRKIRLHYVDQAVTAVSSKIHGSRWNSQRATWTVEHGARSCEAGAQVEPEAEGVIETESCRHRGQNRNKKHLTEHARDFDSRS